MTNRDEPGPIATAFSEAMRRPDGDVAVERASVDAQPEDLLRRARYLGTLTARSRFGAAAVPEFLDGESENQIQRLRFLDTMRARRRSGPAPARELVDEVVWWIEHHAADIPQVEMALSMLSYAPFDAYSRLRGAWDRVMSQHMDDAVVLVAAAKLFAHHESARAVELLERASVLEPASSRAPLEAGLLLWLQSMRSRDGVRFAHDPQIAAGALRWFELALVRVTDVARRRMVLTRVANAAFACTDLERTTACALELLAEIAPAERNWFNGDAIYGANALLGRVAFARGDRETAKLHLSRAGKTFGSLKLRTFGPDFALANELLEAGESEAVLAFLGDAAKFWLDRRLDQWRMRIEKGERPYLSQFESARGRRASAFNRAARKLRGTTRGLLPPPRADP